jgi:hypothetical protein
MIPDDSRRRVTLTGLGSNMARSNDKRAREVLSEAVTHVPKTGFEWDIADALRDVGIALCLAGDNRADAMLAEAAQVARKTERSGQARGILTRFAGALCRGGHKSARASQPGR